MKPGTISYLAAGYAGIMSIASVLIGITEGSWATGLILALIWSAIGTGCFFIGRWRRARITPVTRRATRRT